VAAENPLGTFAPGTRFEEIVEIYLWDSQLRKLMLTYLEPVEIKLKTEIVLKLGVRSPYAHLEPKYLHGNFTKKVSSQSGLSPHQMWARKYLIGGSWKVLDHISPVTSQASGWSHDLRQLVLSLPESNVSHDKAIGLNVSSFLAGTKA